MRRTPLLVALAVLTVVSTACASGDGDTSAASGVAPSSAPIDPTTFAVAVASTDLWAGDPQDVQLGVFRSTESEGVNLLTSGSVDVGFSPFGQDPGTADRVPARYIPAPGTEGTDAGTPALTSPDVARGVYQADDVTFEAGVWTADVTFEVGGTPITLQTQFEVKEAPSLPAPGQAALKTDSLTMESDVAPGAIDSRAAEGAAVPDPELHRVSIAQAINEGRPALVLFATPVYCQSQFCGPDVEWLQSLAAARPDDAAYIHVEIWEDYQAQTANTAASEWLDRDGEFTEPWLFLIDADGTIAQRWGPLFDTTEVEAALDEVAAAPA